MMTTQDSLFDVLETKETQRTRLLKLLRARGSKGIGSYERFKLGIFQMPTRIFELKRKGYFITSLRRGTSRQVFYTLMD